MHPEEGPRLHVHILSEGGEHGWRFPLLPTPLTAMTSEYLQLAALVDQVAAGEITADAAIERIKTEDWAGRIPWYTKPFEDAYHLLQHFAVDSDIRERDQAYAIRQIEALKDIAEAVRNR